MAGGRTAVSEQGLQGGQESGNSAAAAHKGETNRKSLALVLHRLNLGRRRNSDSVGRLILGLMFGELLPEEPQRAGLFDLFPVYFVKLFEKRGALPLIFFCNRCQFADLRRDFIQCSSH